jgi:hypothetical protein
VKNSHSTFGRFVEIHSSTRIAVERFNLNEIKKSMKPPGLSANFESLGGMGQFVLLPLTCFPAWNIRAEESIEQSSASVG